MRSSLVLPLSILLAACGVDHSDSVPADTGTDESASGGTYGNLPGGDEDDTTDTEDTDSDTVDTDVEDTDTAVVVVDEHVTATLYIWPDATWEPSVDNAGHPTVCLFNTADVTEDDWTDYGDTTKCADSSSAGNEVTDTISFVPGSVLSTNAQWNDGTANRNFAAVGNDVSAQSQDWPNFGDTSDQVVAIQFEDGSYDLYQIDSTGVATGTGNAYFYESSWADDSGATQHGWDVRIATNLDAVGAFN